MAKRGGASSIGPAGLRAAQEFGIGLPSNEDLAVAIRIVLPRLSIP
jgi:hypothetical protein